MQKIYVGFLGCGNIGGGVWSLLEDMRADIARCFQIEFEVKKMLVRALDEKRAVSVPEHLLTTNVNDILTDPDISLVCEFMGGEQPAASFMLSALHAGKHVVTANKMALSLHWNELHEAARLQKVGLYYEASVCGAIPVIRTIKESMTASRIDRIGGIVNGTTNYILSQMAESGLSYADALTQAQELGLAEPDPTSDVEGYDAVYKLSILSALCFGQYVQPAQIRRCGISSVDILDIRLGKQLGLALKLLARAQKNDNGVCCSVSPTFVTRDNQLSHVNGAFNGVLLHGHACDDIFLYGRGAGAWPTASAIIGDMIQAAQLGRYAEYDVTFEEACPETSVPSGYYMRISADRAEVACTCAYDALGKNAVSLHLLSVDVKDWCVLLCDKVQEEALVKLQHTIEARCGEALVCWPFEGKA